MKGILTVIIIGILCLSTFPMLATVRAHSTDLSLSVPRPTPILRKVNGTLVPMEDDPSQGHWWDIDYWTDTSGSQLPPEMIGQFVATSNTIGNLAPGDAILYLPLNVAYGTSSSNCVWFQFDVQLDPNNVVAWYIWDINGPGTNTNLWPSGDYHYTSIGLAYTPGHEYDFSLSTSGTNTVTFTILDTTTGNSWLCSSWVWTVPSLNMLYDTSMFSPASAVEGYTTNNQLTNVPYFQTKVGYGIITYWHSPPWGAPSGISSDVNVDSSGYYYWYMYDGSTTAKTVIYGLNWLRTTQDTDGSWYYSAYGGSENVGITSLCALAFLNYGILDSSITNALDWVVSNQAGDGSISTPATGGREDNRVYDTSMAILALVAGRSLGYTPTSNTSLDTGINNAAVFLLNCQCVGTPIDGYTYIPSDLNYGGWGYPRYDWADLSNTQWALLGLAAATTAGIYTVPSSVWKNAAVFTIRCLNDPTYNPKWASSSDGGFTYRPGGGSYESMTSAGVWSLGLCETYVGSVTVDGTTVSLATAITDGVNWLNTYASVTQNYGDDMCFYYYTMLSVAKAYVIVGQGATWYTTMVSQLQSTQASDGHWFAVWWEEPDAMATAEAILAIETQMPPPPNVSTALYVILGSHSNLYITDPIGRHIGINPNTGQKVNEIPDATFISDSKQTASIPHPISGDYNITIFGTSTGPYNLTVEGVVNGAVISSKSFPGTIFQGSIVEWTGKIIVNVFGSLNIMISPPEAHDVAVTSILSDRTVILRGYTAKINVTVLNDGNFTETFNVTLYYNITANKIVGTQNITLSVGASRTLSFSWNTVGVAYSPNYTLTAVATLPADATPADNTLSLGHIKVTIKGDLNGDGTVNILDVAMASSIYGSHRGSPNWNPLCDLNGDGRIDILDLVSITTVYGVKVY